MLFELVVELGMLVDFPNTAKIVVVLLLELVLELVVLVDFPNITDDSGISLILWISSYCSSVLFDLLDHSFLKSRYQMEDHLKVVLLIFHAT